MAERVAARVLVEGAVCEDGCVGVAKEVKDALGCWHAGNGPCCGGCNRGVAVMAHQRGFFGGRSMRWGPCRWLCCWLWSLVVSLQRVWCGR
eukprot:256112-Amphidinium_carterae.1